MGQGLVTCGSALFEPTERIRNAEALQTVFLYDLKMAAPGQVYQRFHVKIPSMNRAIKKTLIFFAQQIHQDIISVWSTHQKETFRSEQLANFREKFKWIVNMFNRAQTEGKINLALIILLGLID